MITQVTNFDSFQNALGLASQLTYVVIRFHRSEKYSSCKEPTEEFLKHTIDRTAELKLFRDEFDTGGNSLLNLNIIRQRYWCTISKNISVRSFRHIFMLVHWARNGLQHLKTYRATAMTLATFNVSPSTTTPSSPSSRCNILCQASRTVSP